MRIGLNCLGIAPNYKGGVNSFTLGLIDGFAKSTRRHRFILFVNERNQHVFEPYRFLRNFRLVVIDDGKVREETLPLRGGWRFFNRLLPARWQYISRKAVPERVLENKADMLYVPHCPPVNFPFPDRPTVYSIHDLQHIHYPEFFSADALRERGVCYPNCANRAALMQASSEQMRDDFLAQFPVLTPEKVAVIQEGVNIETFRARHAGPDIGEKYRLPAEFLYFPAQLWHHKNHITVLKALVRLKTKGLNVPLVLSGARYDGSEHLFEFIAEHGIVDRVFYLGLVPPEDVIALHQAAKFLITAVLYESSSIPILEAAAAGTPIIASETPANLERARDLALNLFQPKDDAALADLLERIWKDEALARRQTEHNARAIARFDWQRIAEDYLDAFERLMARPAKN